MKRIFTTATALLLTISLGMVSATAQDGEDDASSKGSISAVVKDGKVIITLVDGTKRVVDLDEKLTKVDGKKGEHRIVVTNARQDNDAKTGQKYKAIVIGDDGVQQQVELKTLGDGEGRYMLLDETQPNDDGVGGMVRGILKIDGATEMRTDQAFGAHVDTIVRMQDQTELGQYMIGVSCEEVPAAVRAHVNLDDNVGLLVTDVFDDTPAAESLKNNDILVKANGNYVSSTQDLINAVQESAGNDESVSLRVIRAGDIVKVKIQPTKRKQLGVDAVLGDLDVRLDPEVRIRLSDLGKGAKGKLQSGTFAMQLESPGAGIIVPRNNLEIQNQNNGDLVAQIEELRKQIEAIKKALEDKN